MMVTTYATPHNWRRDLLVAAVNKGHEVIVASPESPSVMEETLAKSGVSYVQFPCERTGMNPIGDLKAMRALTQILLEHKPDVLMIYQIKSVLLGPHSARKARIPRVLVLANGLGTTFDDYGFGVSWKARLVRIAYKRALKKVNAIVFQNSDDPVLLGNHGILPASIEQVIVPGSGVNLERFTFEQVPSGPPVFVLVSRLLISKGVRDFVQAGKILRKKYPEVRLRLVGQLEESNHPDALPESELQAWIDAGDVEYPGFVNDVRQQLVESSVFVLPSYYREGVPRSNLEALATGRAIITTDWTGCRDTVVDGGNGFLIKPRDPAGLAIAMERYVADPQLAAKHGACSRDLAKTKFDVNLVNAMMLDALRL